MTEALEKQKFLATFEPWAQIATGHPFGGLPP